MSKKLSVTLIAVLAAAALVFGVLFGLGLGKQDTLARDNAELKEAKETAEASARELRGSLDSAEAEIEKLKGDLEANSGKASQLEKDLEGVNAQMETLNEDLTVTRERAEELARDLESARSESAEAQETAEAANAERTALSAELERYKVKQAELETELDTAKSALDRANSELESVKADLEAKNAELETAKGKLEETEAQLNTARNSGSVAPVTVPDSAGAYDSTRFFTSTLRENGIKFNYEGLNEDNSDIVSSVWTLQDVDVKFLIVFNENGRVFMRAFNIIDYDYMNRGAVLEIVNSLNSEYLFVNWCVDDSDNSVTATYDLPAIAAKDAGKIGYSAMDSMVDVVNEGISRLKQYMK